MFLTGEFSKITQVSKRLLHYYDELGLLKPAHIDPNTDYRYYSANQIPRLNRILVLKELGFRLDQIGNMVNADVSDEEIHGMLLMKKEELEQSLQADIQRLHSIENRLSQNQKADDILDVVIKSTPEEFFLATRAVVPSPDEMFELLQLMQQRVPSRVSSANLGVFAGIIHSDSFRIHNNDVELGFILKKPMQEPIALSDEYMLHMQKLPAVKTMATAVQAGGPELIFIALGKIGQWIEANGYRMTDPYRELMIAAPDVNSINQMVIEIQMPVEVISN